MIGVSDFFSGTLNTVDGVISNFVNNAYVGFIHANAGVITLLFTFYVMMTGFLFLYHHHHFNLSVMIRRVMLMLCVYGLVMNWHLYHKFVYNIFTNEPVNIARILIDSVGDVQPGNIADAMDAIYSAVCHAAMGLFGQVNFSASGLVFILYGVLALIIGMLMCVFALLLFIYAKMMMAVALALGPIFILFILWEPTKGLFSSWLNMLITTALIPVITTAILALMLSVIRVTLPGISMPAEQLQFVGIAPFLGLSLATTLILSQVFRICSSLGGGITLASISAAGGIANNSLTYSGAKAAGNYLKNRFLAGKRSAGGKNVSA